MSPDPGADAHAAIQILGNVAAANFPDWIRRHGAKLGLRAVHISTQPDRTRVTATGPEEMLHAFALACSLGPTTVLVDSVTIEFPHGQIVD